MQSNQTDVKKISDFMEIEGSLPINESTLLDIIMSQLNPVLQNLIITSTKTLLIISRPCLSLRNGLFLQGVSNRTVCRCILFNALYFTMLSVTPNI